MSSIDLTLLFQQASVTALKIAAPLLIVSLVIGLLISVVQAATQINEQTMTFVPKLVAIALILVLAGPWMMQVLVDFTIEIFELMLVAN